MADTTAGTAGTLVPWRGRKLVELGEIVGGLAVDWVPIDDPRPGLLIDSPGRPFPPDPNEPTPAEERAHTLGLARAFRESVELVEVRDGMLADLLREHARTYGVHL